MDQQLVQQYLEAHDELAEYKKSVRETTKERTLEVQALADSLREAMVEHGEDEVEWEGRVVTLDTRLKVSK